MIHGGYWVDGFVAEAMRPMCRALQADGHLEYRRIGGGRRPAAVRGDPVQRAMLA